MTFKIFLPLLLVTAGCQKADRPDTQTPEPAAAPAPEAEAEPAHEHDFPADVTTFHDQMAPLWHAEAGDTRRDNTCAAMPDLIAKADAIVAGDAPEGTEGWKETAEGLVAAAKTLQTICADEPDKFDDTFHALHEAFHALVALVGHEEKGH